MVYYFLNKGLMFVNVQDNHIDIHVAWNISVYSVLTSRLKTECINEHVLTSLITRNKEKGVGVLWSMRRTICKYIQ